MTPTETSSQSNHLVIEHLYIIDKVIDQIGYISADNAMSRDDFYNTGVLGLIQAANNYQIDKGNFASYAFLRIKGSIYDTLRKNDHITRSTRLKLKKIQEATYNLEQKLEHSPSDDEICLATGLSNKDFMEAQLYNVPGVVSLNQTSNTNEANDEFLNIIPTSEHSPEENCEIKMLYHHLGKSIENLPKKERIIISLYHFKRVKMKEIARMLGISESRVCQLHNRALANLKNQFADNGLFQRG